MAAYLVSLFLLNALLDIQVNGIGTMGWGVQWWWTIGTWPEEGFAWINIAFVLNFDFSECLNRVFNRSWDLCVCLICRCTLSGCTLLYSVCVSSRIEVFEKVSVF